MIIFDLPDLPPGWFWKEPKPKRIRKKKYTSTRKVYLAHELPNDIIEGLKTAKVGDGAK